MFAQRFQFFSTTSEEKRIATLQPYTTLFLPVLFSRGTLLIFSCFIGDARHVAHVDLLRGLRYHCLHSSPTRLSYTTTSRFCKDVFSFDGKKSHHPDLHLPARLFPVYSFFSTSQISFFARFTPGSPDLPQSPHRSDLMLSGTFR